MIEQVEAQQRKLQCGSIKVKNNKTAVFREGRCSGGNQEERM